MSITIGSPLDANGNVASNLPTTNTQAGFQRETYFPASGAAARDKRVTIDGLGYSAETRQLWCCVWNSASTTWSSKIGTNATTMTKGVQNGFMRLNNSAITTTTTGISIYSWRGFTIEHNYDYWVVIPVRHSNATASNKQCDVGLGYYAFAAGQAAAMNEFIGFRWTTTGGLLAVVETSQGGAPTSQTENINSNAPYSDSVSRDYGILITDDVVEFYVDGVYQTAISRPTGPWSLI